MAEDFGEAEIAGSFNFTKAAEGKNAESLLVIRSKELAASREALGDVYWPVKCGEARGMVADMGGVDALGGPGRWVCGRHAFHRPTLRFYSAARIGDVE